MFKLEYLILATALVIFATATPFGSTKDDGSKVMKRGLDTGSSDYETHADGSYSYGETHPQNNWDGTVPQKKHGEKHHSSSTDEHKASPPQSPGKPYDQEGPLPTLPGKKGSGYGQEVMLPPTKESGSDQEGAPPQKKESTLEAPSPTQLHKKPSHKQKPSYPVTGGPISPMNKQPSSYPDISDFPPYRQDLGLNNEFPGTLPPLQKAPSSGGPASSPPPEKTLGYKAPSVYSPQKKETNDTAPTYLPTTKEGMKYGSPQNDTPTLTDDEKYGSPEKDSSSGY